MTDFPHGVPDVSDSEIVQVLMPRSLVRVFERRCLPVSMRLAGPVVFSEDDLPTFLMQLAPEGEEG